MLKSYDIFRVACDCRKDVVGLILRDTIRVVGMVYKRIARDKIVP